MSKTADPRISAPSARSDWTLVGAGVGFLIFLLVTGLVVLGWLGGLDASVTVEVNQLGGPAIRWWVRTVDRLLTVPPSLVYAMILAAWLVHRRIGPWALSPLAFLISFPIEFALKLVVQQRDADIVLRVPFGLTIESGSFPSGHAIRGGFFCAYVAVLLWPRGGRISRSLALVLVPLAMLIGVARMFADVHVLSDVVAGLALGISLGFLAAGPVARRLG